MLICPYCRSAMQPAGRSLRCALGHSFDLAREGYVNFLRSRHPGDTREMLEARRRVFSHGHFDPIVREVCRRAAAQLAAPPPAGEDRQRLVLDAGCGEGQYLGALQAQLEAQGVHDLRYIGVDTSREACRLAARRYPRVTFVVADTKSALPVGDGTVDLLLNVFAPRSAAEFSRVLHPAGLLLVVIPQPDHLAELRAAAPLLGIEPDKAAGILRRFAPDLRLTQRDALRWDLLLPREDVTDLVRMSPSHRHLTEPLAPAAAPLRVTCAVELLAFVRSR